MATKQVMVTAPVLVLLYDRAFVSGSFRASLANRRWYYASLAATWLWLGFLMHRSSLAAVKVGFQVGVSWLAYALTELRVVTEYLELAFWPHPLVFDYGTEILATDPLMVALYALVIAAVLAGVAIAWRRSPMSGFLGCCFFLILAPTSTVVPIAEQPMAESRLYLPLAAVAALVTLLCYALDRRRAFVVLGIVAVGLGALTIHRNRDYRSEQSIWEDTVARNPHTSRGQNWFALTLAKIPGRTPDAIAHYEEALRINPANAEAHTNLAIELAKMPGQLAQAMAHYEKALRLQPGFAEAHNNLAIELAKMPGRLPDAITHFEEALRLKPNYARAHNNLALALAEMPGRMPDVIAHYEKALQHQPDFAEAHYDFAVTLEKIPGRMPDAIVHYEQALRLKPAFVEARNNLAAVYAETGRLEAAIEQLEIAARLNPASTAIRDNLGKLMASRKQ
jgi:tetratricopeptide (TPR) repeat protein